MIVSEESSDSSACRGLAEENQFVKAYRLHPRFIRIGGAANEVDAACFQLHDKEQIECCQAKRLKLPFSPGLMLV